MYKVLKRLSIIMAILISAFIAFWTIPMIVNDIKAKIITSQIEKEKPPEQTEVIEVISGCGNTGGTGNHTEIWIGILVKTELSETDLFLYYSKKYEYINIYEYLAEEEEYRFIMGQINKTFRQIEPNDGYEKYFVVGIYEKAVFSELDLRGH